MDQIEKGMVFFACIGVNLMMWAVFLYAKWRHERNKPPE